MGILSRQLEGRATKLLAGSLRNPPTWLREFFGGGEGTAAGVRVDEETALKYVTVFACVSLLAETMGSLPLPVYRRLKPRGKERARDHRLYKLLHDQPNPEVSAFTWKSAMQMHLALWGNCYAEIEFSNGAEPIALWPITPKRVKVERNKETKALEYSVTPPDGGTAVQLQRSQVLHIPDISLNGVTGLSRISLAREAIGLGLAAEEFGSRFFSEGTNPGGVLEHPRQLSQQAHDRLQADWDRRHAGLSKAHRLAILEEGMTFKSVGVPPQDAQFLETRNFQVSEIARLYRVPPHMVGDVDRETSWGTGIEQMGIGFVVYTIRPWAVRWETGIAQSLIRPEERDTIFAEFLLDGLLRGDFKSRQEGLHIQRLDGVINADEWRELENMNPQPDGQGSVYWAPLNMQDASAMGSAPEPAPATGQRSVTGRLRLAGSYRRVFEDVFTRVVRREQADVMRAAEKMLGGRSQGDFEQFVDEFYRMHPEYVEGQSRPTFLAYAEAAQADAAEEVGAEVGMTPELESFMAAYTTSFAARWVGSSRGQILSVMGKALDAGEDAVQALRQRFAEWSERRPAKAAEWETSQAANAVALQTYRQVGIARKTWLASPNPCEFCAGLNGATVEITRTFLEEGEEFKPEGASTGFTATTGFGHPPLHKGCQCSVVPA